MFNVEFPPRINVSGGGLAVSGHLTPSLHVPATRPHLECRLISTPEEFIAMQELRRIAFYRDIEEALDEEQAGCRYEEHRSDEFCDHLIVADQDTGVMVASVRLQSGLRSLEGVEFSAAHEFDLESLEHFNRETTEFSLVCLHPDHDADALMDLLFHGMIAYARLSQSRYLLGSVPLESQDSKAGAAIFGSLCRSHFAPAEWQTNPWSAWSCPLDSSDIRTPELARHLQQHLALGGKICAPPAIDRRFNAVTFLVMHDLNH